MDVATPTEAPSWYQPNLLNGLCHCGCGEVTPVSEQNHPKGGYLKGTHRRFVPYHGARARKLSDEHKAKIGAFSRTRKMPEEAKRQISLSRKANTDAIEATIARNKLRVGELNPNWRGGVTPERKRWQQTVEARQWRLSVFERDHFTCQDCGRRGGSLQAHHIKSWALYPDLRLDVNNGVTLCLDCHKLTDTYGRTAAAQCK